MEILDLKGKKGLVVGIANEESLATWAATHFHDASAITGAVVHVDGGFHIEGMVFH